MGKEYTCNAGPCRRHRFNLGVGKIPWRREWLPTPVFLPGEVRGQRSLAGYRLWGCKESDMTEQLCWFTGRFVMAFLIRSKHLLILCLQSLSEVILEPKKMKSVTVSTFPHLFAMK